MRTPAPGSRSGTAQRWRRWAALLLLLPSLSTLVYAPFLPVPVGPQSLPLVAGFGFNVLSILGLAGIAAAIGVWRGRRWGRLLGAVVTVLLLADAAWVPFAPGATPAEPLAWAAAWLASMLLPAACGGVILFALARRWEPASSA